MTDALLQSEKKLEEMKQDYTHISKLEERVKKENDTMRNAGKWLVALYDMGK